MWWGGSEVINIYLGSTRVGLQGPARPEQWSAGLSGEQVWEALVELLEPACQPRRWYARKPSVSVWLSGAWARPFLLSPVPGLKTWTEAMSVAQSMVAEQAGLTVPSVVWLDAWKVEQACMAVAAEEQVLDRLHALAAEQGWSPRSVRPWWAAALNAAVAGQHKPALLSVEEEGESLTLLAGAEGAWSVVKSVVPVPEQAAAMVQRAMLNAGVGADQVLKARLGSTEAGAVQDDSNKTVAGFLPRWEWSA